MDSSLVRQVLPPVGRCCSRGFARLTVRFLPSKSFSCSAAIASFPPLAISTKMFADTLVSFPHRLTWHASRVDRNVGYNFLHVEKIIGNTKEVFNACIQTPTRRLLRSPLLDVVRGVNPKRNGEDLTEISRESFSCSNTICSCLLPLTVLYSAICSSDLSLERRALCSLISPTLREGQEAGREACSAHSCSFSLSS